METARPLPAIPNADYLAALNPEQRQAVEALDGPVLVLAGAGTGKTRVLTTRIAHILMSKRAFPSQILAVTFTNKAATEMKERIEKLLQPHHANAPEGATAPTGLWMGTFHSIGAKILRRHAEAVGLTSSFTILNDDDQLRLIKAIMQESKIDEARYAPKAVLGTIQGWKDRAQTPDRVDDSGDPFQRIVVTVYRRYQERLRQVNAADFGDLLLHNLTIFQTQPDILQQYAQRFRYILVDEYQDTNVAQYLWLRMLALGHQNICCVGDDDQSIYGWRGAEVGNILKFEQDYPGATVVRLERNYRSTPHILGAASGLIANNKSRLGKTLWTESNEGEKVRVKSVWDDGEEARFVGEEIEAFQRDRARLSQMAILVRAGYQTRSFEERFITLGVPYRVIGGLRFYERLEIRDAIAYLRVISEPKDDLAFERIVNTPKRGLGKTTLETLHQTARANNCALTQAVPLAMTQGAIKGKTANTLKDLLDQFILWQAKAKELSLPALADLVLDESGYRAMWQQDRSPEAAGRLDNLRELVRALGEFANIAEFLEHVGLVMERPTDGAPQDMVNIMTLHAAKGLEFDIVFLTGWEEGLFPSQRSMEESGAAGLEEERRLAYVGITRARKHCFISHAANRRIYNQWQSSLPSRFLDELPLEHIDLLDDGAMNRKSGPAMYQQAIEGLVAKTLGIQPAKAPKLPEFAKGTPVFHDKFGGGVVLSVEGDHLDIAFKHAGRKKILSEYVRKGS